MLRRSQKQRRRSRLPQRKQHSLGSASASSQRATLLPQRGCVRKRLIGSSLNVDLK